MISTHGEWIYLSYPWGPSCPAYGSGARIEITQIRSMCCGDSNNSLEFKSSNHMGTHFDFPLHFTDGGKNVCDYPPESFIYNSFASFWLNLEFGAIVSPEILKKQGFHGTTDAECVVIRTGTGPKRNEMEFSTNGVGMGAGLADYLRKTFPSCRVLCIDSLSLSSYANRELGRQVHREFLSDSRPILAVEDMNLEAFANGHLPKQMLAFPLRIEKGDGAPCTVIGNF